MSRRVRFGSTTNGVLDALDGQIDTGNENGNNPDNDLVIRDSNSNIVMRYDESAEAWTLANNDLTGVGALEAEKADITGGEPNDLRGETTIEDPRFPPTGSLVYLSDNITIPHDETIDIEWDSENIRGEVSDLLDDGEVVVPEGYSYAKITSSLEFDGEITLDAHDFRLNGSNFLGNAKYGGMNEITAGLVSTQSAWVPVSSGDSIGQRIRQQEGEDIEIMASDKTWMEVRLV